MTDDIKTNLCFLANHLSNIESILLHLIEKDIISQNENDEIKSKDTPFRRNTRLLEIIQSKEWPTVKELFLEILRKTTNGHCANAIDGIPNEPRHVKRLKHNLLRQIWWPEKKRLIKSLHERKIDGKLLVDELHEKLEKDENRMVVITESSAASKLTGMGGVGKTLTATWYAHKYENYYDHVLWIDCGEGSLLTSFKKLARDMKIQDRSELIDEEEFSRKSYEELMQFKCLWIFDNAENYRGQGGMKKVLPNFKDNFSCLITSRSRDWGIENIGYGKISDLQLDIFSEQESMEFLRQNLKKEIKYTEFQLKELCRLLGNLPLAMQLAVAALNVGKIDLENYIKETSIEDIVNIVDAEFDAYEKTINASVKITLDLLSKENNGMVAKDILIIFGYIRPDDVVLQFFQDILELSIENLNKAFELLVKYSLISKESKTINGETKLNVGIHRLLQQVVRHNGRNTEKDTLRKILGCRGYVAYKLLPFTKYADEELRSEFPKVKAELLDQQQLVKLLEEKRFQESVELAKFIHKELQKDATKFNYAICLERNGQLEDNVEVLEELYQKEIREEIDYDDSVEIGLLRLEEEVGKSLVGGHLLVSLWKMDNKEKLKEIMEERKSFKMIPSEELMTTLFRILKSKLTQSCYSLIYYGSMLELVSGGDTKTVELKHCTVDISLALPNDLQKLVLDRVLFKNGNKKELIDVSEWLAKELNTLEINCSQPRQIIVSLESISSIENISFYDCSLNLDSVNRISARQLQLSNISFVKNGQELSNIKINEFTNFHKMNRLELTCWSVIKNVSIDLKEEESANMEYLELYNVTVMSLKSVNGKVSIKKASIRRCSLDLSILPQSLEKLSLFYTKISLSGGIDLPNLKYLELEDKNISLLSHFRSLHQLTHLHLVEVEEVNLDIVPASTKIIIIDRGYIGTRLLGGVIHLDKLILYEFSMDEVEEMLPHFHPEQVVLYYDSCTSVDLIQLMKKQIPRIAIGRVDWEKEDFKDSVISKHVNQQSEYYLFHEGKGKSVEQKEFEAFK